MLYTYTVESWDVASDGRLVPTLFDCKTIEEALELFGLRIRRKETVDCMLREENEIMNDTIYARYIREGLYKKS